MTYRFIGEYMELVEKEYMQLTDFNTNNKINGMFDINNVSIYIKQRIEDYQINRLTISTYRKHKMKQRLINALFIQDIADRINEFMGKYDKIELIIDILYHPFNHGPVWNIFKLDVFGIDQDMIENLVNEHNIKNNKSISLPVDLSCFIRKFNKLLKHI
jgi:hypothetical protein